MADQSSQHGIRDLDLGERSRVTRELHDIEQSLAILGVQMMRAGKAVSGMPGALHPGVSQLADKLREIGDRVGRLSKQLHSSRLKSFDLTDSLQQYCRKSADESKISVECRCQNVPKELDNLLSLSVLRVVQEAVDNAVKHSHAKTIRVDVQGSPKEMRLLIADDGIGFDVEEAKLAAGLGLISMRERIHLAEGEFDVSSKKGDGTRVSATIPLKQQTAAKIG